MKENQFGTVTLSSETELERRLKQVNRLKKTKIPDNELLLNLGLYQRRQDLSHILFTDLIYQKIIGIHGVIMEFGVRWGRNLALFENLRGIYEPYNYTRRIIGFDTFEGFPKVTEQDGEFLNRTDYSVSKDYLTDLHEILQYHEQESPITHITKYELIKGDVMKTLSKYLKDSQETIIALAYMDLDLYEPTKEVLKRIIPRMPIGAIIAFDELNHKICPGETIAFQEILGINNFEIHRNPMNPCQSWIRIGNPNINENEKINRRQKYLQELGT